MDVRWERGLTDRFDLPGLEGVAGRVEEAVVARRLGIRRRPLRSGCPLDAKGLDRFPLGMREWKRRAAPDLGQRCPLRDGRAERAISGVEHLVTEDEAVVDRKSTRLNSSHVKISYAVFCL